MTNELKYRSELLENALHITIPSPKNGFAIIVFTVWVVMSTFGCAMLLLEIVSGVIAMFSVLPLCLSIWLIIGIYHLLWQLVGMEEIRVTPDSIEVRQAILGIGRAKVYPDVNIYRIRIDPLGKEEPYALDSDSMSLRKGTGMIAFDYAGGTVRIGIGLNVSAAHELVAEIQRFYAKYTA